MKVIKKGMVVENEKGELSLTGWTFNAEGGAVYKNENVAIDFLREREHIPEDTLLGFLRRRNDERRRI